VRKSSVEEQGPGSPHMEGSHVIRLRPRMEKLRKKERKKERKIDRQRQRQKERKKGSYVFRLRRELRKKDKKERKKERKDSMSFVCRKNGQIALWPATNSWHLGTYLLVLIHGI